MRHSAPCSKSKGHAGGRRKLYRPWDSGDAGSFGTLGNGINAISGQPIVCLGREKVVQGFAHIPGNPVGIRGRGIHFHFTNVSLHAAGYGAALAGAFAWGHGCRPAPMAAREAPGTPQT